MKKLSQRVSAIGALLSTVCAAACSDDPRIPSGEHFSERVTGVPGVVMIDDMEDGTQYLITDNGIQGLWYTYNDESAGSVQEPSQGFPMYRTRKLNGDPDENSAVPARNCGDPGGAEFFAAETDCTFVARTWGDGQRGWGAGMGLDLNGEGGAKNAFDASRFAGIGFFVTGTVRNGSLRVNVQDVRTTPESALAAERLQILGCEAPYIDESGRPTETAACNDHYGVSVGVTNEWQWIEIPFSCMAAGGWGFNGLPPANVFLKEAIVGIQFQIEGADPADTGTIPANSTITPFDFSIDNLSFLEASRVADPPVCPPPPTLGASCSKRPRRGRSPPPKTRSPRSPIPC
jgi:hypothetical protein